MQRSVLRVHAALGTVALLFSINYVVAKIALREIDPLAFAWLRVVGAAALLHALARSRRSPLSARLTRSDLRKLVGYTFLGVVFNQLLFINGLARTSAHEAAILITTIPIFTLIGAFALRLEKASLAKAAGIAIAASGALLIIGLEGAAQRQGRLTGDILILLNCISYGTYLVVSRPLVMRLSPARVIRIIFTLGIPLMLPFSIHSLLAQDWSSVHASSWAALAVVVAGPTVGAYLLNAWALARIESSVVAAYTYLQPVFASILAFLVLGERLSLVTAAGALLIIAGVWLASGKRNPSRSVL
ncbi:MAG: DMT family transporter [Thermoanaerobaculia bacterium]